METILRASSFAPLRQDALETFDSLLSEISVQHHAMHDALQCAALLPLHANEPITRFIDTRDALENQMHALGAALYHALTAGHGEAVAELMRTWPAASASGAAAASNREADVGSSQSASTAPRLIGTPTATERLDRATVPPEQELPIDSGLHLQASERIESTAPFRASGAQALGMDALMNEAAAPAAVPETLHTEEAPDAARAEEEPAAELAEAPAPKKSSPRIATRIAADDEDATTAPPPPVSLDSLVKPAEARKILAEVTPAPRPRPAHVDEAVLNRLNGNLGVKGFVETVPEHVPHYFIENHQLTQPQLEKLNKVLKQLTRPPAGSISNFPAYVGALGAFISPANLEDFADLSKELCLAVMKVVVAYHRFLESADTSKMFVDTFKEHWSAIRLFTSDYDAGFIPDMSRDAQPEPGPTWREATHARLADLERLLETQLSAVQAKNAENSKAKREKQSNIDQEFNRIERLTKAMLKDIKLAGVRAGLEKKMAERASEAPATPVNRRKNARTPKKPEALVHGLTPAEEKVARAERLEQISAGLQNLLALGCRTDHPRLFVIINDLRDYLPLTGPLQPIQDALDAKKRAQEQAQDAPEDTTEAWPFRDQVTKGKKAFIIGGQRKSVSEERIKEHFGFEEVKWLSTNSRNKGKKQLAAVQRGMRDGRYDFYIAIENLVAHAWTWMIFGEDAADNVHPVLISGYGVRALELELERTLRLTKGDA